MSGPAPAALDRLLRGWTRRCRGAAWIVVFGFAIVTLASAWLAATHLTVNTDTSAMMSATLPWRKAEIDYARTFPQNEFRIVAVVDAPSMPDADAAARRLAEALQARPDLFSHVEVPFSGPFFDRNGLMYLDTDQLETLATNLEASQAFLGRLSADPSLAGFFGLLTQAMTLQGQTLPIDLAQVLDPLTKTISSVSAGSPQPLSWASMIGAGQMAQGGPRLVLAQPVSRDGEREAVAFVREQVHALGLDRGAVRVRLTGEAPLWIDELDAAGAGAVKSALAAMILGAGFLWLGLRSGRLLLACLACLVSGLVITAGFAAIAVGRLNMISLAFSTLYIGVAIDYGVQLCMRYRELRGQGLGHGAALEETGGGFGAALVLCAMTTVAGFFAFLPTDYRGVAELGIIAGTGIVIGLFTSLTLLPALLELAPPPDRALAVVRLPAPLAAMAAIPQRHPRAVRRVALLLAVAALALVTQLRFDYNPMHLKPLGSESLLAYEELVGGATSPLTATIVARDAAEAERVALALDRQPAVLHAITLARLVPDHQDDKRATLDDLQLALALPPQVAPKPVDIDRDRAALQAARHAAATYAGTPSATAAAQHLAAVLAPLENAPPAQLESLRNALLAELPPLIARLSVALSAQPFTAQDLPAEVQAAWRSADGRYRVEVQPRENLDTDAALLRFVDGVLAVAPDASGSAVTFVGAARTVIAAFVQAFALAAGLIVVFLCVLLRSVPDALRALAPLVLGSLLLGAAMVLTGAHLNFANVIALPLLLGIGVDIGVLILWRARSAHAGEENPVVTGTGAAVVVSVLATLGSFASLMLSADRGMSTIGEILTIGLLIDLVCTFLVLPALLPRRAQPA